MDGQEAVQEAILEGRDKSVLYTHTISLFSIFTCSLIACCYLLSLTRRQLSALLQTMSPAAVAVPIDEEGTTLLHLAANTDNPRVHA